MHSAPDAANAAPHPRPSFVFFGVVAAVSLVADVGTKIWAESTLTARGYEPIELIEGHLGVILAFNKGGAFGLLQDAPAALRLPFFLGVSVAAVWFLVSLYAKLHPSQRALHWGLPLVLGGALGNLADRITRGHVIDFIDYQSGWVLKMNELIQRFASDWYVSSHWPTFNVADIAICIGVGLMVVDMFTSRRLRTASAEESPAGTQEEAPASSQSA